MNTTSHNEDTRLDLINALSAIPGVRIDHDFETDKKVVDLSSLSFSNDLITVIDAFTKYANTSDPLVIVIPDNREQSVLLYNKVSDYHRLEPRYNRTIPIEEVSVLNKDTERAYTLAVKKAYNAPLTLQDRFTELVLALKNLFKRGK